MNSSGSLLRLVKSEEPQKEHISVSQINEYLDCSAYYMFRRVYRMPTQSKSFLTIGKSVHKGIEINYKQKRETRVDLPLEEIQEVTAQEFKDLELSTQWGKDEDVGQLKDLAVSLATLYHTQVAPTVQPVLVEQKIIVDIPEIQKPVMFVLDLVDEEGYIRDTKTPGRTPSQKDVDQSLQLTGYSFAYRHFTGKTEKGVKLDNLVKTKTPKYVQLESIRTERQIQRFINIANAVIDAIKSGSFIPNQNSWKCSEDTCDFWEICHRDF